jgi:phage-related protein
MPIITPFFDMFKDWAISVLPGVSAAVNGFMDNFYPLIDAFKAGYSGGGGIIGGITNALYSLGDVSPIFTDIGDAINSIIMGFQGLSLAGTDMANSGIASIFLQIGQAVKGAFDWLMNDPGAIPAILAAIGVAVAAFAVTTIISMAPVIASMLPVIAIMAAVGAAVYFLYTAWTTNWGGIRDKAAAVWAWLQPIFEQIKTWLQVNIPIAIQALSDFWNNVLLPAIVAVWQWVQNNVFPIIVTLIDWLATNIPIAIQKLSDFWTNTLLPAIQTVWKLIQQAVQYFLDWITPVIAAFQDAFSGNWTGFGEKLREAWDKLWQDVKDLATGAWDWLKAEVPKLITQLGDWFKSVDWGQIGTDIIHGIAAGLTGALDWLKNAAQNAAQAALDAAKGFLGIHSPSVVFAGVGQNMMQGWAQGITENAHLPAMATANAAGNVTHAATDNRTYNFNYNGNATPQQIYQSFEMAKLVG